MLDVIIAQGTVAEMTMLEQLSNISNIVMGLLAVIAAAIAWYQVRVSHRDQKRTTAKEIYREYLERAFENPKLSSPSHPTSYYPYNKITADDQLFEQYEWYVSYLLLAVEEILDLEESEQWKETLKKQIRFHTEYLNSHQEQLESCSEVTGIFVKSVLSPSNNNDDLCQVARRGPMIKLSVTIWALILVALGLVFIFIKYPDETKLFLGDEEVFKLTFQFLLITAVGGGVALLYKQLEHIREIRKSLREMHAELLDAFNLAKKVRRELRAQLGTREKINPDEMITAEMYEKQMELISDAQMVFEVHAKRGEDSSLWFWGDPRLSEPLSKVESYLNDILKEYQDELSKFSGTPPARKLEDLKKLTEFIGPYTEESKFAEEFKYPIRVALQALGKAVLR